MTGLMVISKDNLWLPIRDQLKKNWLGGQQLRIPLPTHQFWCLWMILNILLGHAWQEVMDGEE